MQIEWEKSCKQLSTVPTINVHCYYHFPGAVAMWERKAILSPSECGEYIIGAITLPPENACSTWEVVLSPWQEQTGLSPRVSTVLTVELTAANSSHLWAGQQRVRPAGEQAGCSPGEDRTAGTARSQGPGVRGGRSQTKGRVCWLRGRREGSRHVSIKNGFFPRQSSAICGESRCLYRASFSQRALRVGVMSSEVTQSLTEINLWD